MKFVKQDVINEIAKMYKIPKYQVAQNMEMLFEGLVGVVSKMSPNDTLKISGFLHIDVRELNERMGKHPKTKEPILKPKKKFVRAKLGKRFTEVIK